MSAKVILDEVTDYKLKTGDPNHAHIVKGKPGQPAAELVVVARINGTSVESLCGYIWVPTKNPRGKPLCPICKDIYDLHGDLGDAPRGFDPSSLPG